MRATSILPEFFGSQNPKLHRTRLKSVTDFTNAICYGAPLTISALGRALRSESSEKTCINRSYSFLSNPLLAKETKLFATIMAVWAINNRKRPIILIDWTDMPNTNKALQSITASIPMQGRSLALYSEVYSLKHYNTGYAHNRFLKNLFDIIPKGTQPILVTDAGFRVPWCKAVAALEWYYVTRLRSNSHLNDVLRSAWMEIKCAI